jgi:hypothetical protein
MFKWRNVLKVYEMVLKGSINNEKSDKLKEKLKINGESRSSFVQILLRKLFEETSVAL